MKVDRRAMNMKVRPVLGSYKLLAAQLRAVVYDSRGVAAVEFALIVPVMMLLMLGVIELSYAIIIDRRVQQVAETVSDLTARLEKQPDAPTITNIVTASQYILAPYPYRPAIITLQSIVSSPTNAATQYQTWSCTFNSSSASLSCACSMLTYTLPQGVIGKNEQVIVGTANYDYKPISLNYFLRTAWSGRSDGAGGYNINQAGYMKPRGTSLQFVQANGVSCPSPEF